VGERSDYQFGEQVDHSKSQPKDDKLSLKWAWSRSRDLFKFLKIIDSISEMVQLGIDIVAMEV